MPSTTTGALKVKIESLGLGIPAYRDAAPEGHALPYVRIIEAISTVPDPMEDHALGTGTELVQIDLFQAWRDASHAPLENYTLPGALLAGLEGAQIGNVGSKRVYTVLVRNMRRLLEEDNNIVHHVIDVDLKREL